MRRQRVKYSSKAEYDGGLGNDRGPQCTSRTEYGDGTWVTGDSVSGGWSVAVGWSVVMVQHIEPVRPGTLVELNMSMGRVGGVNYVSNMELVGGAMWTRIELELSAATCWGDREVYVGVTEIGGAQVGRMVNSSAGWRKMTGRNAIV